MLVTELRTSQGMLVDELFNDACITLRQVEFIKAPSISYERNTRLLGILIRGSQSDFDKFMDCLQRTGHEHVHEMLRMKTLLESYFVGWRESSSDLPPSINLSVDSLPSQPPLLLYTTTASITSITGMQQARPRI